MTQVAATKEITDSSVSRNRKEEVRGAIELAKQLADYCFLHNVGPFTIFHGKDDRGMITWSGDKLKRY